MANGAGGTDAGMNTVETESLNAEESLRKWRQKALSEGIAPTKIDAYIAGLAEVPPEVKDLIRKLQASEGVAERAGQAGPEKAVVPGVSTPPTAESARTQEISKIEGELDMLDSGAQIKEIKDKALSGEAGDVSVAQPEVQPTVEVPSPVETPKATQEAVPAEAQPEQPEQIEPETVPDPAGEAVDAKPPQNVEIHGYSLSDDVKQNAGKIAESGSIEDSNTWGATLWTRLVESIQNFMGSLTS